MENDKNLNVSASRSPKKPRGIPFTPLTAKQAQKAAARARTIRKQVRAQMLDTLVENMDFGDEMLKAIRSGDAVRIDIIAKALTVVGLTHNQSEDAVQNVKVDSKSDSKVTQTVRFCLAPRPEKPKE